MQNIIICKADNQARQEHAWPVSHAGCSSLQRAGHPWLLAMLICTAGGCSPLWLSRLLHFICSQCSAPQLPLGRLICGSAAFCIPSESKIKLGFHSFHLPRSFGRAARGEQAAKEMQSVGFLLSAAFPSFWHWAQQQCLCASVSPSLPQPFCSVLGISLALHHHQLLSAFPGRGFPCIFPRGK